MGPPGPFQLQVDDTYKMTGQGQTLSGHQDGPS